MATGTNRSPLRWALVGLTGFIGLTAFAGGLALLVGAEDFPLAWLEGTPFSAYTLPALLLTAVGLVALVAAVAVGRRHRRGRSLAGLAGLLMAGYVAVEAAILAQDPPGPTPTEMLYLGLGLLTAGLALAYHRASPAP